MKIPVHKGPLSIKSLQNGDQILQFHRGKMKLIVKEFNKVFEMELSNPNLKEVTQFAKYSDIKAPQKDAIKVFKDGVRVAAPSGKSTYLTLPSDTDNNVAAEETQIVTSGVDAGKLIER